MLVIINSTTLKTFNLSKDKDTKFNKNNKLKRLTIRTLAKKRSLNIIIQLTSFSSKSKKLSNTNNITLNTSIVKVDTNFKAIKDIKVCKLL